MIITERWLAIQMKNHSLLIHYLVEIPNPRTYANEEPFSLIHSATIILPTA